MWFEFLSYSTGVEKLIALSKSKIVVEPLSGKMLRQACLLHGVRHWTIIRYIGFVGLNSRLGIFSRGPGVIVMIPISRQLTCVPAQLLAVGFFVAGTSYVVPPARQPNIRCCVVGRSVSTDGSSLLSCVKDERKDIRSFPPSVACDDLVLRPLLTATMIPGASGLIGRVREPIAKMAPQRKPA